MSLSKTVVRDVYETTFIKDYSYIRVVLVEGEVYWCAKDLQRALGSQGKTSLDYSVIHEDNIFSFTIRDKDLSNLPNLLKFVSYEGAIQIIKASLSQSKSYAFQYLTDTKNSFTTCDIPTNFNSTPMTSTLIDDYNNYMSSILN